MEYLYLNFDSSTNEQSGGLATGTKIYFFKKTDFPEAAAIKVKGVNVNTNVINMMSISKIDNKGYYVDAQTLEKAHLVLGTRSTIARKAGELAFNTTVDALLRFIKKSAIPKVKEDLILASTLLPLEFKLKTEITNFGSRQSEICKQILNEINELTKLQLDTFVIVTYGITTNKVSLVETVDITSTPEKSETN